MSIFLEKILILSLNSDMKDIGTSLKMKIDQLPKTVGVYLFYSKKEIIYTGKAINIKDRVKNHFNQPSYRDNLFINKVDKIDFIETDSEIEALVMEANLIKKNLPRFNVVWRDDKNYFYVAIAQNKQKIPYVYITHQPFGYAQGKPKNKLEAINYKLKANHIGPFVEGNSLKKTLKFLHKVFPYYTTSKHIKQKCTWCHLDLCPGPDPDLKEYKKNIKKLTLILKGKRKNVLSSLKKEMSFLAKNNDFEKAGKIRDRMYALQNIMAHTRVISNEQIEKDTWVKTEVILNELLDTEGNIKRIECYDISNIQGKQATGSMVVFVDCAPSKGQYKKFKIRMKNEPNDIAMLKETLERRFSHPEWQYPEVILIDGGIAQLNVTIKTKNKSSMFSKAFKSMLLIKNIKIISIAKGRQELFIEGRKQPIPLKKLPQDIYNLVKHLDDEAHRFAISYHKFLRRKKIMGRNA